jgi:small redox-active disulfide protein 2
MKELKVLGTGCPKCKYLENAVREVVAKEGIEASLSKVEDIMEIMKYGVLSTPALVVNGRVVLAGKVPTSEELKTLIIREQ